MGEVTEGWRSGCLSSCRYLVTVGTQIPSLVLFSLPLAVSNNSRGKANAFSPLSLHMCFHIPFSTITFFSLMGQTFLYQTFNNSQRWEEEAWPA